MNKNGSNLFDQIRTDVNNNDVEAALEKLLANLKANQQYHQMFEVLKMQTRHRLNLPPVYDPGSEKLDALTRSQLESGLLEACRTVGLLLVADQKLREGWVYLQPLDDRGLTQSLIEKYEINDDNADEVIDIALMQQAAPNVGFRLVLERYGTCNAITSFESAAHTFDRETRAQLAELLANHLHVELTDNLQKHLKDNNLPEATLTELIQSNSKMLAGAGPLVDATHLSSTLRIGRCATSRDTQLRLCEMAKYGCQLDESYHFPGDAPFENTYRDHLTFYRALAAERADADAVTTAIEFFDNQSLATTNDSFNSIPDEVFVDLLFRLGHNGRAIKVSLERLSKRTELTGIASSVHQMAREPEHFQMLETHYLSENDLLGFAVSVMSGPNE